MSQSTLLGMKVKHKNPVRVPHLSIAVLGGQPDRLPMIIGGAEDGFAAFPFA